MTSMLVMMAILFAIVYFFMIRPQNKRQKAIDEYRKALHVGSDVVTVGGLHGTVKRINEENNTLVVNVATGVDLVFEKSAIVPPAGETKA
ncbi:MAG: preprotein translocase subunit YajC [Alloprevotella sp.]|nr:preprotein translocase subunit YajC [Alloprevotella sp.]